MAKKRKQEEEAGYNFMDTYGDMMTLLLTFFILLFSMSTVDAEKWEILVKAFSRNKDANTSQIVMIPEGDGDDVAPAVGEDTLKSTHTSDSDPAVEEMPEDINELYEKMKEYVEQNSLEDQVTVEKVGENNIYMSFDNNIFFDGDSAVLRPTSYDILNFMGDCFTGLQSQILLVKINGHTAAIPNVANYGVNDWDLSSSRANRVASYFEEVKGFDPKKLMTNGYGKNHPIADNSTEEGRAKNRRVDIQILGNDFDKGNADELYDMLMMSLDVKLYDESPQEEEDALFNESGDADLQVQVGGAASSSASAAGVPSEAPVVNKDISEEDINAAIEAMQSEIQSKPQSGAQTESEPDDG